MPDFNSLSDGACAVLSAPDPSEKARLSRSVSDQWQANDLTTIGDATVPDRPARPARPELLPPNRMPKRRAAGETSSKVALLHAIAHIELNAIDLAWDLIARFTHQQLPRAFYDDWVSVAAEEAKHFEMVRDRLTELGASYGDLPAHDGLWQAAEATADDLPGRLAVVPLVLEARGLDVTPAMINRLRSAGDTRSAEVLETIYRDEIGHVAIGKRWFDFVCQRDGIDSLDAWRRLVPIYFRGQLKPPFNADARIKAGLTPNYYEKLAN